MRIQAAAVAFLLALPALAEEPKTGIVDGEWHACKYALVVPSGWEKKDAATYSLFVTFPPGPHEVTNYGQLWSRSKGSKPFLALTVAGGMSAPDTATLVEKVRTEYGFDPDRLFVVTYGEGGVKGLQFVQDNADLVAGFIILQPSFGYTEPKASGKSVPVLMMNDKACSFSPPFQAQGLKGKFETLGYETTYIETDNPAEHDGWPVNDMSKMFDWAAAIVPFKADAVFDEAAAWLAAGSKDTECRPKVRGAFKKYVAALGDQSPGAVTAMGNAMTNSLKDGLSSAREIKGGVKSAIALVAAAKGKKVEGGSLVICDSADFDSIEDAVIIASGDVKANHVKNAVIFAKGAVTIAKDAGACLIHAGGHVKIGTTLEDATILALGGVEAAGKAKNNWFVNTADVKIKSNEAARTVKRVKLPGGK